MPSLLQYLLRLRFYALARSLRYLAFRDPLGLTLAAGIMIAMVVFVAKGIHRPEMALILVLFHAALIQFLHGLRKDAPFLASLGLAPRSVFMWEYSCLALVSAFPLVFTVYPLTVFLPFVISCGFALLPSSALSAKRVGKQSSGMTQGKALVQRLLMRLVPPLAFEWWGGLRTRGLILTIHWIGAILLAWQPFLLSAILFFLILIPIEFYGIGEHRAMAQALYRSPRQFLLLKIGQGFRCYALLLTPLVALGMAHYAWQHLAVVSIGGVLEQFTMIAVAIMASLLVSGLLAALCVLAKYSFYVEGLPFMFAVSSAVLLTLATLWHPFISVIGVGVSFSVLIPKATKRLEIMFS